MRKILPILLLLLLSGAILQFRLNAQKNSSDIMRSLYPEASHFKHLSGSIYRADTGGGPIGYLTIQSAAGYGGPITVLVKYSLDGVLRDVRVVTHSETPSFFQHVINKGFLDQFHHKNAADPFSLGEDIDGITSATYTSRGIAMAVRKGAHELAAQELNIKMANTHKRALSLGEYCILALIFLTYLFSKLRWPWLRPYLLGVSFVVMGLWQNAALNINNIAMFVSGRIPPWNEMPPWVLPAIGILALIALTGRNLYCYWLCPFGCVMQMAGKLGQFAGINSHHFWGRRFKWATKLGLWLAWGALTIGFLLRNPGVGSYEPFSTLFSFRGNTCQWILMVFTLLTALLSYRFWCRFLCPIGAICDLLPTITRNPRNIGGLIRSKKQSGEQQEAGVDHLFRFLLLIGTTLVLLVLIQNLFSA